MTHIWEAPNSTYQLFSKLLTIPKIHIHEKGTQKSPGSPAKTSSQELKNCAGLSSYSVLGRLNLEVISHQITGF